MRLNKFIAHYSTYSRREADETIRLGFVKLNGEVQKDPAVDVNEEFDEVRLKGKLIEANALLTVVVYNKKKGELVTKKDPKGRKTIYDTLPFKHRHLMPVGRLDFASEGLLLLTDNSEAATLLMNSKVPRLYKIKIQGKVTAAMQTAMKEGLHADDATKGAHELSKIKSMTFAPFAGYDIIKNQESYSILKVSITEGQNRELRRFFGYFDCEVLDLKRISFGAISLDALPDGKSRYLSRKEYTDLKEFMKELKIDAKNPKKKEQENIDGND